jgi:hypothetical protein
MKLIPIEGSSNIQAVGDDPQTREMQVQFKGGAIYTHQDVSVLKHAQFIAAKSKGSHYHDNFRGKHNAKKLEAK